MKICPLAKTCNKQVLYHMPIWDKAPQRGGVIIGYDIVKQGHCKPHHESPRCNTAGQQCPICEESEKPTKK